jgi:F420-dependent oxidoreductase-like protein
VTGVAAQRLVSDSLTWRYLGDWRTPLMAQWAGSLQNMHPELDAGVEAHSRFFAERWQRRSLYPIGGVVYDGPRAAETARAVRGYHDTTKGVDARGRRYHALNTDTFYWTHSTFFKLTVIAAERMCGGLAAEQKRRLFEEHVEWYWLYGLSMRPVPATWEEFQDYWERMCTEAPEDNKATRDVLDLRDLAKPPAPAWLPGPVWRSVRVLVARGFLWWTVGLYQPAVRERLGYTWSAGEERLRRLLGRLINLAFALVPHDRRYHPRARAGWRRALGEDVPPVETPARQPAPARGAEQPDALLTTGGDVKLGYHLGYWSSGPPAGALDAITTAEELGFDSVWTAEGYGSDALTPLAWWGAATKRIKLGTNIIQMSARTPTAVGMSALTLDHLSGGRFVLGLGASGPQVVEGWYGQPYPRPLARTREYVDIVRQVVARREPVTFDGDFYQLPLPAGTGLGKPLKSTVHPLREEIPIYLAAEGPKNVALSAEICDGWLPLFFSPKTDGFYRAALAEGFARPGARHTAEDFEVAASVPVIVHDDVEAAADFIRPSLALYIGGMGAKEVNFHHDVFARMGYADVADKVQDLYLAGRKAEATVAIPTSLVEDTALIGPPAKIRAELAAWEETVVTTLLLRGDATTLRAVTPLLT